MCQLISSSRLVSRPWVVSAVCQHATLYFFSLFIFLPVGLKQSMSKATFASSLWHDGCVVTATSCCQLCNICTAIWAIEIKLCKGSERHLHVTGLFRVLKLDKSPQLLLVLRLLISKVGPVLKACLLRKCHYQAGFWTVSHSDCHPVITGFVLSF